jgi:hypothetical protein
LCVPPHFASLTCQPSKTKPFICHVRRGVGGGEESVTGIVSLVVTSEVILNGVVLISDWNQLEVLVRPHASTCMYAHTF